MTIVEWLEQLGGVAPRATLVRLTSRAEFDRAVAVGDLVRVSRSRFSLPGDAAALVAARLGGVLCLTSAALQHGWAVKRVPDRPHVLISRGRRVDATLARTAHLHRGDVAPGEVEAGVTDAERTLRMCARQLPEDEGVAVADSARRAGVPQSLLDRIGDAARGPGAPRVRWLFVVERGRVVPQGGSCPC